MKTNHPISFYIVLVHLETICEDKSEYMNKFQKEADDHVHIMRYGFFLVTVQKTYEIDNMNSLLRYISFHFLTE